MHQRCYIGSLRLILDIALEDGGSQGDKDQVLLLALSKVQRSLRSSKPLSSSDENFQLEVEDCTLLKEAGYPCTKDLEGLSSNLVFALASESSFTNHAAGKTFMALFDYLLEETSLFAFVMNFVWKVLCACFSGAEDAFLKPESPSAVVRSLCLPANHRISTSGCKVAMHLFQIVHGFLRKTKEEGAAKLTKYLASSAVCIPEVLLAFTSCFTLLADNPVKLKLEEEDLLLAALLRVLCSFNHSMSMHSDIIDTANYISKSQFLGSVNRFLVAFSQHCLYVQHGRRLSYYLRHKILMLMFRLHEWFIKWPSLAITCSDILKSNISTLCPSLFQRQTQLLVPSTLSPFAPSLLESKTAQSLSSSPDFRPERHAVFLLFEVETSLRKTTRGSVSRTNVGRNHSTEQQEDQWMLNWLSSQVSMVWNTWSSGPGEVANRLASSFLQIFVDEDTLMLEMLLLLQDSFIPELISGSDHDSLHEAQKLLTELFKPLRLFAVFLSLVSYDHSVILDFLISKDTSISCLQYLMRCMRMVKNTWPEILSLSHSSYTQHAREDELKELDVKSAIDGHTSDVKQPFVCDTLIDIDRVGTCLMDLKHAVQKLHTKHAFPYNPSPLLKHLESFEHLWLPASS